MIEKVRSIAISSPHKGKNEAGDVKQRALIESTAMTGKAASGRRSSIALLASWEEAAGDTSFGITAADTPVQVLA
jgi:hypothetical protein